MSSGPTATSAQLLCMQKGGPFEIVQIPKPTLAPDHVLIRQSVIALNGLDTKQRDFGILVSHWPHVLGIEGAGVVEAVGADVKDLSPGDELVDSQSARWKAGHTSNHLVGGRRKIYATSPGEGGRTRAGAGTQGYG